MIKRKDEFKCIFCSQEFTAKIREDKECPKCKTFYYFEDNSNSN